MISAFTDNIEEYWDDKPAYHNQSLSNNDTFELDPEAQRSMILTLINILAKESGRIRGERDRTGSQTDRPAGRRRCTAVPGNPRCAAVGAGVAKTA